MDRAKDNAFLHLFAQNQDSAGDMAMYCNVMICENQSHDEFVKETKVISNMLCFITE